MKIELILPVKNHSFSKNDIEFERLFSQRVLPKLECLISFLETHDIMDTQNRVYVKNLGSVGRAYTKSETEPFQFIICKN